MPVAAPLLLAAAVIAAIAGMAATTYSWTQQRTARLHAEIDSDIRQMLRQHAARKQNLAAAELRAPGFTTGAGPDGGGPARKAQIGAIRKPGAGQRRERFLPPDFARLPIAVTRGVKGLLR